MRGTLVVSKTPEWRTAPRQGLPSMFPFCLKTTHTYIGLGANAYVSMLLNIHVKMWFLDTGPPLPYPA